MQLLIHVPATGINVSLITELVKLFLTMLTGVPMAATSIIEASTSLFEKCSQRVKGQDFTHSPVSNLHKHQACCTRQATLHTSMANTSRTAKMNVKWAKGQTWESGWAICWSPCSQSHRNPGCSFKFCMTTKAWIKSAFPRFCAWGRCYLMSHRIFQIKFPWYVTATLPQCLPNF